MIHAALPAENRYCVPAQIVFGEAHETTHIVTEKRLLTISERASVGSP
jgi:hypothetical protein